MKVISLLYDYYDIFSHDFKKSLDAYVFDRNFYRIFLHWCGHVRRIFYLLLEHKMALKFREIMEHEESESSKMQPLINLTRIHQYHSLLDKLKFEDEQAKSKSKKKQKEVEYFCRMKEKLEDKKIRRKIGSPPKKCTMSNSCHDSPQMRKRI